MIRWLRLVLQREVQLELEHDLVLAVVDCKQYHQQARKQPVLIQLSPRRDTDPLAEIGAAERSGARARAAVGACFGGLQAVPSASSKAACVDSAIPSSKQ